MREILTQLNNEIGAIGSMVITPDGIMVAAALGADFEEDAVAAFASSLLLSLKRVLSSLKCRTDMSICTLHASKGRISFFNMHNSYLMVVTDSDVKLDTSVVAVQAAIHKIKNRRVA